MYPPCPAHLTNRITRLSTLVTLALVVFANLLSVTCSHAVDSRDGTGAGRTVRAGIFNFKPLVIFDQKAPPKGFIVEILNHIAKQEQWNVEYVPGTWQESLERLRSDKIDIILCIGYSAERDEYLDFPKEHVLLDWGLVYRKKGSRLNTIMDMEGKTIAAMKASIYTAGFKSTLEQFNIKANIVEKTEVNDVFGALESGEADAAISSTIAGLSFESSHKIDRSPVVFTPVKLGYAVNSGKNADLTAAIDKRLAELKSDKNSYYYKKFDEWVTARSNNIPEVFYWIIGAISGVLFVFIIFVVILRWQVKAKTIGLKTEIEQRKLAEAKLITNTVDLKESQHIAHVGSWRLDLASNKVLWSDELYRMYGFDPSLPPPPYAEHHKLFTPESWEKLSAALQNTQNTGIPYNLELKTVRPDGSSGWMWVRGMPVLDGNGVTIGLWGMAQDITERKQIEEVQSWLLQISAGNPGEDFFETLARYLSKTLDMGYVCIDTLHGDGLTARTLAIYHDGKFEVNVEYALKDTPCGDVVGKEVCVFPRQVCSLFPHDPALQELQAESYLGTTLWSFDMKPIGLIAVIGRNELVSSHFAESVMKLVSIRAAGELERRQAYEEKHLLEQQFQQTQKLESLGVLAGGIAHDFNNILAIIIGYCGLTRLNYQDAEKHIPEIEKAAERAAGLCRQMLAYAGQATLTQSQVNSRTLVDEMVSMLKTTIQQNVVIKPELDTDIPLINGDANQLRQVVMNLIINAAEAIGDAEGEIEVKLANAEIRAEQPEKDHLGVIIPSGRYICFEVTDNGCGMDDETRRKIFEPFYTTKFTGRGLGMSAVLGIIKAHNGALQLESQPGQGTTFRVYLHAQLSKAEIEEAEQVAASTPWQGNGTILLVEDEVQIRSIATIMIQEMGFNVLDAANGKEALELYQQNAADISLVITDMGMPVMNGYELFYRLKQLDPKLPVIISSGFGEVDIASKIPREQIAGMINKPYRFDQLRDVIRGVVEST